MLTADQEVLLAALVAAIRRASTVANFLVDDEHAGGANYLLLHPGFTDGMVVADGGDIRALINKNLLAIPPAAHSIPLVALTQRARAYVERQAGQ